ncbi:MAG: transposase [Candidatus Brocadiaceae bacterium]|nr:transposase [Candidatus Brocadiaceae bacterium]
MSSDGAKGFLSSTKEHAKIALIVLDHFQVKRYLNEAVKPGNKAMRSSVKYCIATRGLY